MDVLSHSLRDLIKIELDDEALEKLAWKDFGDGLSMSRLAREGARELVLYRIKADADPKSLFAPRASGRGILPGLARPDRGRKRSLFRRRPGLSRSEISSFSARDRRDYRPGPLAGRCQDFNRPLKKRAICREPGKIVSDPPEAKTDVRPDLELQVDATAPSYQRYDRILTPRRSCVKLCVKFGPCGGYMPTNLAIDDKLLERALRIGKHRTKRETVNDALKEYIQRRKRLQTLKAFGTMDLDPRYDYKKARAKR